MKIKISPAVVCKTVEEMKDKIQFGIPKLETYIVYDGESFDFHQVNGYAYYCLYGEEGENLDSIIWTDKEKDKLIEEKWFKKSI